MNRFLIAPLVVGLLAAAGCDSGDSPLGPPPTPKFYLQVTHASPDAPPVNVLVNGDQVLSGVDYKQSSGRILLPEGSYSIAVEGILAGNQTATVIPAGGGTVDLDLSGDKIYNIIAINDVVDIEPFVIEQDAIRGTFDTARVVAFHAARNVQDLLGGPVDVYVTAPGAALDAPAGSFEFKDAPLELGQVPAGDYQIRVGVGDPVNDPGNFLLAYDSGRVTLNGFDDLVLVAVPNTTGLGDSPISLLAITPTGALDIPSAGTPTGLRVLHASNDAGSVTVTADGPDSVTLDDVTFLQAFPGTDSTAPLTAGDYEIAVTPTGQAMPAIGPVTLPLNAGITTNVIAVGTVLNNTLGAIVADDDIRSIAVYGKLRVIHASDLAASLSPNTVDIFVEAPGTDISDTVNVSPAIAGFGFGENTGFIALPGGPNGTAQEYEVTVTVSGSRDAAIGPAILEITNGDVLTAVAVDGPQEEPGALDLTLLNDTPVID